MDLRSLRYFVASFEEGSISGAARRCNVAQPSVSHAVQKLEAVLGAQLFQRSVTGLTPTPAGIALANRARAILADVAGLKASISGKEAPAAIVRLFVHPTVALRKLARIFEAIGTGPEVDLRLVADRGEADLAIVPGEGDRREQPLWAERYELLMAAKDPLARRERLRIADLVGMRMIARCACERPHILPRDVIKPIIVAQAHDEESVRALVSAGIGLAVVPGYDSDTPEIVARQVEEFAAERWVVAVGNPALVERARKAVRDARLPLSL